MPEGSGIAQFRRCDWFPVGTEVVAIPADKAPFHGLPPSPGNVHATATVDQYGTLTFTGLRTPSGPSGLRYVAIGTVDGVERRVTFHAHPHSRLQDPRSVL